MPGGGSSSVVAQQASYVDSGQLQERKKSKEIIHSGHFMVSDFEAEARDDDDEVAIPVPEDPDDPNIVLSGVNTAGDLAGGSPGDVVVRPKKSDAVSPSIPVAVPNLCPEDFGQSFESTDSSLVPAGVTIDQSLTKLFQCMTLAYSSKLTSPRWKNFKGLRLQWKDKIRLNNLIWRCWHMQFIERRNTAVCQFASPLEVDQHNKPEAVVLEGKYWKRRLATVTAEYKKWRIFFKNQMMGRTSKDLNDLGMGGELDQLDWFATGPRSNGNFNSGAGSLTLDDDFFMDFTDTLFSSLSSNQPFPFPNPREIAKGAGLADFIQPGLIQLQPNLDDFMDTLEPLHELLSGRLPPVEEEIAVVEEHIASRNAEQQQRNQQSQLPYSSTSSLSSSSSSSTSANNTAAPLSAGSGGELLNYLPMDQSAPAAPAPAPSASSSSTPQYLQGSSLPFGHALHTAAQLPESTGLFSYATPSIPSASSSPSPSYEVKPNPQMIQGTGAFVASGTRCNPFDAMTPTLQRQNSGGSDHGFAVPTTQFQGKQRSRSRSGSGSTTPTNSSPAPILPHPAGHLSASQPAIALSGRSHRAKTSGGTSISSPARLLHAGQESGGSGARGGGRSSRMRTPGDLQPIMPVPQPHVSPPARSILPDSSTLLAQLLTSSNPQATLVLSSTDSSSQRIPVLFPLASAESADPGATASVTLLPAAFTPPDFKRELPSAQSQSASGNAHPEDTAASAANPPPSGSRPKSGSLDMTGERIQYKEHRRVCHINAEQKRRCNIKNGFDTLQSLLPSSGLCGSGSSTSPSSASSSAASSGGHGKSSDVSKAAMLHRGAEYIRLLRQERQQQQEEMEQLRQTIESLNAAISGCQALLPPSGAPVCSSRQRSNRMREMFDDWVRTRTLQNWKFWIFSILIQPLLESYSSASAASTYEDLWNNVLNWVDQYCSLIALRPVVFNSLRNLSKTTDILTNPSRLPAEATQAACNPDSRQQQQGGNGTLSTT